LLQLPYDTLRARLPAVHDVSEPGGHLAGVSPLGGLLGNLGDLSGTRPGAAARQLRKERAGLSDDVALHYAETSMGQGRQGKAKVVPVHHDPRINESPTPIFRRVRRRAEPSYSEVPRRGLVLDLVNVR